MVQTIRVVAHITARSGKEASVKSTLSGLVEPTRQEPGCIRYELLQNLNNLAEFTLLEEWESQTALDGHTAAADTKAAETKMESLIEKSPPDVRFYRSLT